MTININGNLHIFDRQPLKRKFILPESIRGQYRFNKQSYKKALQDC